MKKQKPKVQVDYTAYHVRQQAWYMSLLKFYNTIEFDEKKYIEFAKRLFDNKIDKETLTQLDKLRRKHNDLEKKKWQEIKKKGATKLGIAFRNVITKGQGKIN